MDGDVAETHNVRPLDFRMTFSKFHWQSSGGLANHDEFLKHGALAQLVVEEVFALNPF